MTRTTNLAEESAQLFTEYLAGERASLERLVELLNPTLWHLARACGLSRVDSEDVIQTAWLRMVDKATTIREPTTVLAWLGTTLRREAWRVRGASRRELPGVMIEDLDPTPGPDELAVLDLASRVLWRHFSALNPRCQALLRVVSQGGRPDYASLCEALDMPVGSIGPTRGRCLAALRRALTQDPEWSES